MAEKKREYTKFMEYGRENGTKVAKFRWDVADSGYEFGHNFVLTIEECLERLRNLKISDLPHEQTLKAIEGWPTRKGGRNVNRR